MTRSFFPSLLLLGLAACGGGDTGDTSTTKLDAVEVQPGSVSDSMIILDDAAGDGTAVDNSVPDDGNVGKAADEREGEEDAAPPAEADDDPDAVDMPTAKKAVTPDATANKGE
ncbi:hypothetical protein [Sphingopyxis sp. LK2115]|jgi:hypothetical protein|uniref:hypothetical protein n=1 Tax=Sphingopyxis sp. LK2115 TaxID=2744558 RepID=UPI001660FF09|nr:hypothetical protein [Sphingopyxis sp. LK2115]